MLTHLVQKTVYPVPTLKAGVVIGEHIPFHKFDP